MKKREETYLSKPDADLLRKYCKGCQYFKPEIEVKDICSMVSWYNEVNIQEVQEYVKHCPCNKKCLVKAACRDGGCPDWIKYMHRAADERNKKLMEERCKNKTYPATGV